MSQNPGLAATSSGLGSCAQLVTAVGSANVGVATPTVWRVVSSNMEVLVSGAMLAGGVAVFVLRCATWLIAFAVVSPVAIPAGLAWLCSVILARMCCRQAYRGVSSTAIIVLAWRAISHDVGARLDPAASRLLCALPWTATSAYRAFMASQRLANRLCCSSAWGDPNASWWRAHPVGVLVYSLPLLNILPVRTALIDRTIDEQQPQQVVVLGAGFDTRAWGGPLSARADIHTFEVDMPSTQRLKRSCLHSAGLDGGLNVTLVACDFEERSWRDALHDEPSFDPTKRTMLLWEGVSYYLTPSVVESTMRDVAAMLRASPGSLLAMDVIAAEVIGASPRQPRPGLIAYFSRIMVAFMAEPFRFGVPNMRTDPELAVQTWARTFGLAVESECRTPGGLGAAITAIPDTEGANLNRKTS